MFTTNAVAAAPMTPETFGTIDFLTFKWTEQVSVWHIDRPLDALRPVVEFGEANFDYPFTSLAYTFTDSGIIPSHCFRYLEFWSIGGLEIQTRSPKLRNSPQRKQYRKPTPPASP